MWGLYLLCIVLSLWTLFDREAGCTPFASSLITDFFDPGSRASALGVYNWGIYMGYSLSYALGNFITRDLVSILIHDIIVTVSNLFIVLSSKFSLHFWFSPLFSSCSITCKHLILVYSVQMSVHLRFHACTYLFTHLLCISCMVTWSCLQGWRWAWFTSAIPGLILGPLIFLTVREPVRKQKERERESTEASSDQSDDQEALLGSTLQPTMKWTDKALLLCRVFLKPSILLLCLGGSIRNAGL